MKTLRLCFLFSLLSFFSQAQVAAIGGPSAICVGSCVVYTDATGGGTWSSSNPGVAMFGSTSGILCGVSAGVTTLTYSVPSLGGFSTMTVSVNPIPVISGASTVCDGSCITLSGGGTWSSSNVTILTVGSASGLACGVASGTATITCTLPTGCFATHVVTVNPSPAAITGSTSVCVGSTTTLSDATPGGTWTSSNTSIATVGASTGIVTAAAAGLATITYSLPTGCLATLPVTAMVTPAAYTVTGGGSYCSGLTGVHIGLSGSQSGVTYQLYNGSTAVGSAVSGTGIAIDFGLFTSAGTYTVIATATGGCTATMTGSATVGINPLPTAFTVTGGGGYCAGGAGVAVSLSGSTVGVNYQLMNGTTPVGAPIAGTGGSLSFGLQTVAGTYTVIATIGSTGCSNTMTGSATVMIDPAPHAYTVTGGCGASVTIGLSWADAGFNYWLYRGTTLVTTMSGLGMALTFGTYTTIGTYTVVAVNSTTGCTATMTGSATVTTVALPTAYTVTGGGSYCSGGSGVAVGLGGSQTGVTYQLYNGSTAVGSPVSGTGSSLSFGLQTAAGTYTVVANPGSCSVTMTGSAIVSVNPTPTAFTVTGGGTYCSGGGLSIGLSGSQTGVTYSLFLGTTSVGSASGTGSGISFGSFTTAGTYTVTASGSGCTNTMTGSATITSGTSLTAYSVTGGGSFCTGGTGVAVGLSGSQSGVSYQLYNGSTVAGSPVTGGGSTVNFGLQTTAGTYTVHASSGGCTSTMTGSAVITINPLPLQYTVTGGGAYCSGGSGVAVGLSGSQAGVNYELMRGASLISTVAGTGSSISFGLMTVAGTYTVVAVDGSTSCTNNMLGSAMVTVTPLPTAYSVTGGGSYCSGGTGLLVGLSNSQTGISYQLYNGAALVGSPVTGTGAALNFGLQTSAGTYTVVANPSGCSATMSGSALIGVNPLPTVFTVGGGGSYCSGPGVTISLSGSQAGVQYQLYNGGSAVGSAVAGTGGTLSFGPYTIAGTYTIRATTTGTGCISNMSGSAVVTIGPVPTVYSVTGGGSFCSGGAGVAVGLSNSQAGVTYQLYNGSLAVGSPAGGTGAALNFGLQTTAGTYTVVASPGTSCAVTMSGSAIVTVTPSPTVYAVTGGGVYCPFGAAPHIGISNSQTGVTYQLYRSGTAVGTAVAGTGSAIGFGTFTTAGTYTVVANPGSACAATMSGSATVTVTTGGSLPATLTVGGGGSTCSGSTGVPVTLPGSSVGFNYGLYRGGVATGISVPGTGTSLNFGLQTIAGSYTVVATNATTGCATNMTGSANVSVYPSPAVYSVTGGGSYCSGGSGVPIGLSGSASGIHYQLYRGTTAVGSYIPGSGTAISFGYQTTAGTYTVVAMNATTFCTSHMSGSAAVVVNPVPAIAGSIYTVAPGASITLTSTTGGGSWSSSNTSVATVGISTGGVTGVALGTTTISYTLPTGCRATHTVSVTATGHKAGAEATGKATHFSIVPNPNNGSFVVRGTLASDGEQDVTLGVTNMLGQQVYATQITAENGAFDKQVQLSVAPGMYLVAIQAAGEQTVLRIIVQ